MAWLWDAVTGLFFRNAPLNGPMNANPLNIIPPNAAAKPIPPNAVAAANPIPPNLNAAANPIPPNAAANPTPPNAAANPIPPNAQRQLREPPECDWVTGLLGAVWKGAFDAALRVCFSVTLASMTEIDGNEDEDRQEETRRIAAGRCIKCSKLGFLLAVVFAATSFLVPGLIANIGHNGQTSFLAQSPLSRNAFTTSVVTGIFAAMMQGYIVWVLGIEGVMEMLRKKQRGILSLVSMVIPVAAVWNTSWISEIVGIYSTLWNGDNPRSLKMTLTTIIPFIFLLSIWRVLKNLPSSLRPGPLENV